MSLRVRLLVALVALTAAGLIIVDTVTATSLRAFLYKRVDQQLVESADPVAQALQEGNTSAFGRVPHGRVRTSLPPGTYGDERDAAGAVQSSIRVTLGTTADAQPEVPKLDARLVVRIIASGSARKLTTDSNTGATRFRVLVQPSDGGGAFVVAVPMGDADQTLHRLLLLELGVSVVVLAILGGVAWWAVRLGLRPLERIEDTAGAIAGGDLSRRVDVTDPATEVGRLGVSLNEMLSHIETAFTQRAASEDRLRRFLADASHELRTPLTSIRGYAELFRRGADKRPEDLAKVMRRIEDEAGRMGILVEDLLLLARLDEGRPMERAPVDITAVVADAVEDARARDPEREVRLEAWPAILVPGDGSRLHQVVANLLANAVEHTAPGTPVEVRVRTAEGFAEVDVTDHGPGMTAEQAGRVFDRFYRADPSRTRASGGAGLGLAIVAAIVTAHDGTVAVRTAPGQGATFRVRLPLTTPAPAVEPVEPAPPAAT